ncbi:MAG: PAS domain S-box protein [Desulfarculus sp.]|nr:MAG: PAS domain S-box protein [Desulfarculus sp.]
MSQSLGVLNRILERFRPLLARGTSPTRQGRALLAALGGELGASAGALCAWQKGGGLALCAAWALPPRAARRLRTLVQQPPAQAEAKIKRLGQRLLAPGQAPACGWPALERALGELAGRRHLAVWSLPRAQGSGLALLCLAKAPRWQKGLAPAAAQLLSLALENVLLKSQALYMGDDYARIFQNSRDMIYLSSREGRWVDVNQAGVDMLGYDSREQLLAVPDSAQAAYLNPADRQAFQAAIEKDGFVKDYEVTFKRRDGAPIEVAITSQVRKRNGAVVGYEGIIKDITERKKAQARAEQEHSLVASILEVVPAAIFVVDRDHKVMHWNRACEELTGWRRQDILGTDQVWRVFHRPQGVSLADLVVADDPRRLREIYGPEGLRRSPLAGDAWEAENYFPDLGGRPKWLFFSAAALRGPDGRISGAVEAILDTTDLKELQRKLAESEALYRTLVESNREGIALHDYERFVFANQAFLQMFGLEGLNVAGGDFLKLLAEESRRPYLEWLRRAESGEASAPVFEGQGLRAEGPFDLELTATPCPFRGSSAMLFTSRDVTLRKSMEEQLIRSERLAATGKLAFDIAHEVNNPLGGILTYAHLMGEDLGPDNEQAPTVEKIIKLANRCKIIVRGLLDFARQDTPEKEPLDLNWVLREVLSLMEGHLILRTVEVVQDLDPSLPEFWGHRVKLEQVFLNLLINAAEAMQGQGQLNLSTRWDPEAGEIRVRFADSGPGVPAEAASRIFEPFFTTKPRGRGTGLGLAISHGIITQHGGRVELDSRPGEGAVFTIHLPSAGPLNDIQSFT